MRKLSHIHINGTDYFLILRAVVIVKGENFTKQVATLLISQFKLKH